MRAIGLLTVAPIAALLLWLPPSAAVAAPRTHVVVIDKMKFGPTPNDVKVGDTIIWDNRDMFRHTATGAKGAFNVDLKAGTKGKTIMRRAGRIAVTCKYHPGMRGMLEVKAR
jgi:plastocyanin